ncbi:hypothetical protein BJI62_18070 [Acinetobacter pittii]|nr:hypothetical protein BJI62_18070 [Acinetobacter pittii]
MQNSHKNKQVMTKFLHRKKAIKKSEKKLILVLKNSIFFCNDTPELMPYRESNFLNFAKM